jgi:tetratricopeptide (TPR) repeat protein
MWEDVAASNIVAYKAAIDLNARMHLAEGREDCHTLSWLEYANLMMAKFDEAQKNVELAKHAAERNPSNAAVQDGYRSMRARYILEAGKWEKIPLETPAAGNDQHAAHPGMDMRYPGRGTWIFIAGLSAAKLGDAAQAEQAAKQLGAIRDRTQAGGNTYSAKVTAIMEKEIRAAAKLARGDKAEAIRLAKEASDVELTMSAPSGPPEPIKPALEFYGEVLLAAGKTAEARQAFQQQLLRTPNRTPSLRGLAQATGKPADLPSAHQ